MYVRSCTRCRNADGVPTGRVLGGECFLCRGSGTYVRQVVSAEAKLAGRRRADAINALRAAGAPLIARTAREHLEETAPVRHASLITSVLAGRTTDVIAALVAYAGQECL